MGGFNADGGDIFRLTPEGVYSIIYDWCPGQCTSAEGPTGTLVRNPTGGFFGATQGNYTPSGNVFALSAQNTIDVLYTFSSPLGAKTSPVLDGAGNLFGIAGEPFGAGGGSVYEITPDGVESTVYTFSTRYGIQRIWPPNSRCCRQPIRHDRNQHASGHCVQSESRWRRNGVVHGSVRGSRRGGHGQSGEPLHNVLLLWNQPYGFDRQTDQERRLRVGSDPGVPAISTPNENRKAEHQECSAIFWLPGFRADSKASQVFFFLEFSPHVAMR